MSHLHAASGDFSRRTSHSVEGMNCPRFSFENTKVSSRSICPWAIYGGPTGPLTRTTRIRSRSSANLGIDCLRSRSSHWR